MYPYIAGADTLTCQTSYHLGKAGQNITKQCQNMMPDETHHLFRLLWFPWLVGLFSIFLLIQLCANHICPPQRVFRKILGYLQGQNVGWEGRERNRSGTTSVMRQATQGGVEKFSYSKHSLDKSRLWHLWCLMLRPALFYHCHNKTQPSAETQGGLDVSFKYPEKLRR